MKMVLTIDVEELFNLIENADYEDAHYREVKRNENKYSNYSKWKADMDYAYWSERAADEAVYGIIGFLKMDPETQRRMRIAARSKRKWERKTNYERLLTEDMKKQYANFIFGDDRDDFVVEKSWMDGEYRRV